MASHGNWNPNFSSVKSQPASVGPEPLIAFGRKLAKAHA
jgi:hypothetical protein